MERKVTCPRFNGCNLKTKPASKRSCKTRKCRYGWTIQPWGRVSILFLIFIILVNQIVVYENVDFEDFFKSFIFHATLFESQIVKCEAKSSRLTILNNFKILPKSQLFQSKKIHFFIINFPILFLQQCSKACGRGIQKRKIGCRSRETFKTVHIRYCDKTKRPPSSKKCYRKCKKYTYRRIRYRGRYASPVRSTRRKVPVRTSSNVFKNLKKISGKELIKKVDFSFKCNKGIVFILIATSRYSEYC